MGLGKDSAEVAGSELENLGKAGAGGVDVD